MGTQGDKESEENKNMNRKIEKPHNLKRKVEILNSIKKTPLTQESLPDYFSYASQKDLAVPVLKAVLNCLIEIDSQLSATYEITSEDDWKALTSLEIVLDENFELKTKLDCFVLYFNAFCTHLESLSPAETLNVLSRIFLVKTRNIQFLVFLAAKSSPREFFTYLLINTRKSPSIYAPFLSSLLVRLNIDFSIKQRCLIALHRHFQSLNSSTNPEYLILLQNFMYILCFKEFSNYAEMAEIIKKQRELFGYLNKDVVTKFCGIYNEKDPVYKTVKNSVLYFFPFDLPVIPKIVKIIEGDYISFI